MQAGLIDYWDVWFRPMPPQCQENIKSYKPIDSKALKTKDKSPADIQEFDWGFYRPFIWTQFCHF
jgi:hypothetical protein